MMRTRPTQPAGQGPHPWEIVRHIPRDIDATGSLRGVWSAIGVFFFVCYFITLDVTQERTLFFWDMYYAEGSPAVAMFGTYVVLAGIVLVIIAHALWGIARGIAVSSIGVIGLIFLMIAAAPMGMSERLVQFVIGLTGLAIGLVGNDVRLLHPASRLGRVLSGLGAGVCLTVMVIAHIRIVQALASAAGLSMTGMSAVERATPIVALLSSLAIMAACGPVVANVATHSRIGQVARAAQTLALIGVVLLGAWLVLMPTIAAAETSGKAALWPFLLLGRTVGIAYGLLLMIGGGLADLLRNALSGREPLPVPQFHLPAASDSIASLGETPWETPSAITARRSSSRRPLAGTSSAT